MILCPYYCLFMITCIGSQEKDADGSFIKLLYYSDKSQLPVYDHHWLQSISNGQQNINNRIFHISTHWLYIINFPKQLWFPHPVSSWANISIKCRLSGGVFSHTLKLMLQITWQKQFGDISSHKLQWGLGIKLRKWNIESLIAALPTQQL